VDAGRVDDSGILVIEVHDEPRPGRSSDTVGEGCLADPVEVAIRRLLVRPAGSILVRGMCLPVPGLATLDVAAVTIPTGTFVALLRLGWGTVRTPGVAAVAERCSRPVVGCSAPKHA